MMSYMSTSPLIVAYTLFIAALLGLTMGSFINCWAWRYMNGESVLKGRSHCTSCGHDLSLRDLIPVFSWLASGGKCRYCGERVSARYPATELVCAIAFVGIVAVYGLTLQTVELLAFAGILLFLSLTDLDDYLIPNGCIISAIVIRVVYLAITFAQGETTTDQLIYYAASGFGVGIALVVVVLIADFVFGRDSMGGGDLKLYFVAGLYFGWQQCLLVVILSCIFGIAVALTRRQEPESKRATELVGGDSTISEPAEDANPVVERSQCESTNCPATERVSIKDDERKTTAECVEQQVSEGKGSCSESVSEEQAEPKGLSAISEPDAEHDDQPATESDSSHFGSDPESDEENVMKRAIPFGPSIAAACVVVMLVGEPIINWYSGLL